LEQLLVELVGDALTVLLEHLGLVGPWARRPECRFRAQESLDLRKQEIGLLGLEHESVDAEAHREPLVRHVTEGRRVDEDRD
jgi:hypothetical protein